jgi:hypothetical protein
VSTVDTRWFKSSYSTDGQGSDCVEVAWLKSSYSTSGNNSDCVEVAFGAPVAIRDSKAPEGELHLSPAAWTAFLTKSGGR